MTKDVTVLNRTQKVQLIHLTMQGLQAKIYYLYENYNSYHENYSEQALQLYNVYNKYESAVQNLLVTEEMNKLDDDGLTQMAALSLEVSDLYKLGVRTPDDQKEYEETIAQFKEDVYAEALKRLEENKKETDVFETDLLAEAKSKGGKNLTPVYEYYDLQKQINENQYNIDYAEMMGNSDDYSKYYAVNKDLKYKAKVIKENTPLLSHLPNEETIVKDIKSLCNKIRKAQTNVEKKLINGKYPIWELNPVIAYIFETNEFYTPDKQEYIFDWIKEQERIDQLVDVFKNAIPITLSIMCFFMPGGASVAMLILQGANTAAGALAAYDDIQDAKAQKDMAYSQYTVSADAQKIIDDADLSAIERNYAMAILSGAFTMLDFAECIKIARKLGIGDDVMKYFAQGRKFRLSTDETDDLVRKAGQTVKVTKKGAQKSIKFVNGQITGEIKNALKTEPGTAFFWSGCAKMDSSSGKLLVSGDEVAAEIASKCGGTTLETQIKINNIEMPKWDFDVPESIKAWEDTSAAYAKQVSGDVRAIVGPKLRTGNIWENVELPRLLQNPNVSKITTIDPDTLAETVIFERKAGGKVYIRQNDTLVKNGDWDKIIDNLEKNGNKIDDEVKKANLLDKNGEFSDVKIESDYQKYIKRKKQKGETPRDRLDWKEQSDYWRNESPIARGNNYNKIVRNSNIYPYHEIHLENGKRLDSYDMLAGEIISRKATDLDKISEDTFRKYLSEFKEKYSKGTKIRSNAYPQLDGMELNGQYILEIPATNAMLSDIDYYKKIAEEYDVILRFTEEIKCLN